MTEFSWDLPFPEHQFGIYRPYWPPSSPSGLGAAYSTLSADARTRLARSGENGGRCWSRNDSIDRRLDFARLPPAAGAISTPRSGTAELAPGDRSPKERIRTG